MVRTLLTWRWLLALVVAAVFAVTCVLLGRWQWGRYEDKALRAATVSTNYGAPPVPLASVSSRLPLTETGEWTRVTATGTYDAAQQLLVRNRVQDGLAGLEVLVPLTVTAPDGTSSRVLVDRGWVQNADTAAQAPTVPAVPEGPVTVQGWLRRPEPSLGRDLPSDQLASIAIADAQAKVGGPLLPVYVEMESERTASGASPARPAALGAPDTDLGPNQAYAFQWWLFSVFGFVFYGYRARVTRLEQQAARAPVAEPDLALVGAARPSGPTAAPPGTTRTTTPTPAPKPKPKKVRIWDEEDS